MGKGNPSKGYIPATGFILPKKYDRPTTKQICSWKHFPEGYFLKQKQPSKVAGFHFDTLTELFYLLSFCTTSPPDSAREAPISRALTWDEVCPFQLWFTFQSELELYLLDRCSQLGLYVFLHRCCWTDECWLHLSWHNATITRSSDLFLMARR